MSSAGAGGSTDPSDLRREILEAGPLRNLDPRLRRFAVIALLVLAIVGLALRIHRTSSRIAVLPIKPSNSSAEPAPDINVAYTHALPDPSDHETFIAMELLNASGRTLKVSSAKFTGAGVPVSLELLSHAGGNEVLGRPIAELSRRFVGSGLEQPLTVQAGELFYVLIRIRPKCGQIGNVAAAPILITYAYDRPAYKRIEIPVQDITGAISWLDDAVGQACGTASGSATETTTRIVDGVTLTTTGPEIIPSGPFTITITATNFARTTFTGSIGIFVQGEIRVPAAGSHPVAGGLAVSDHAPNVFIWHGTGYMFNGTGWYLSGVLHSGEKMVPGGSFVWTFQVSYKRPLESVGQLRGWLPALLAVSPDARPSLPDAGTFPELNVR